MVKGSSIIVVGVNRGGTSAVASSLNSVGIFLGDSWREPNYEDVYLAKCFRNRSWSKFRKQIKKYEASHDVFAWKLPDSINRLIKVDGMFSSPKYIFVFRDIYAIGDRINRARGASLLFSMFKASLQYLNAIFFIKYRKPDCLLVSYEKMLTNTDQYARQLLDFLEMEKTSENIESIVTSVCPSPSGYQEWADESKKSRERKAQQILGHLDYIEKEKIGGWLRSKKDENPVSVDIYINKVKVGNALADNYRQDLVDAAVSNSGCHGFVYTLDPPLKSGDTVSVVLAGTALDVKGSPRQIG